MTGLFACDEIEADERAAAAGEVFVASGRVVPGLEVRDDGRARSWWWPLPVADDRDLLASCCAGASVDAQRDAAARIAAEVDRRVRARFVASGTAIVARRGGRRTVQEAWLQSLVTDDPWLPATLDRENVHALEHAVTAWVAQGTSHIGGVRCCLRVREPSRGDESWQIDVLAQDADEPSLVVSARDVWRGRAPLGENAIEELLAGLGRLAWLAPELAPLLDEAEPTSIRLDTSSVVRFARERVGALTDAGIGVLLPAWWARRRRLGLRAKVSTPRTPGTGAVSTGGVGMDAITSFEWRAALGDRPLTRAELRALVAAADAKQELVRVRGEWVELSRDDLEAVLARHGATAEASVTELLRAGLGLDSLGDVGSAGVVGIDATGWLGRLLDDALHATLSPIATPDGFAGELRPYQELGVGWLTFLGRLGLGACLADDMGLGKTAQLLATILSDPVPNPTLVVCPVSVLGNWQRELARFAPHLKVIAHHGPGRFTGHRAKLPTRARRADVVLTTYSLVARDIEHLDACTWGRIVFDEAQQVKNPAAAQSRAAQRLCADRRVALTGTPVENRLSELWSIMHVLNPGLLGSAREFRERFAVPIERESDADATARLRRITTPFVLRRLKTDRTIIQDLPEKIETTEACRLTKEQASLYQAVVDDLIEQSENAEGIGRRGLVLAGLMRLKQVCNHPAHFLRDGSRLAGRSGKLTRTDELFEEILEAGDKVLLFTQFAEWGRLLAPYVHHQFGIEVLWLHGGVARRKRDDIIERFQDAAGPQVLIASLKAGGTGLNLTAASHVVHFDRWWNPAVEDQATDRAYRIGQHRTVLVHKLVTAGTIEERIDEMIASKRALAENVVGSGEQWVTELSTEELRAVVALRAEAIGED